MKKEREHFRRMNELEAQLLEAQIAESKARLEALMSLPLVSMRFF